jgi:hypothetical protein
MEIRVDFDSRNGTMWSFAGERGTMYEFMTNDRSFVGRARKIDPDCQLGDLV